MGFRLSRIYTRTGDDGSTGLGDGARVPKDDPRVEAIGAVDELNSVLGLLRTEPVPEEIAAALARIQHTLFDLGGELALPGRSVLGDDQVAELEQLIDRLNAGLEPLKEFILPGGAPAAALSHVARSVCRRAERRVVTLGRDGSLAPAARRYLNRLSDLLFVMARRLNRSAGVADVLWQPRPKG